MVHGSRRRKERLGRLTRGVVSCTTKFRKEPSLKGIGVEFIGEPIEHCVFDGVEVVIVVVDPSESVADEEGGDG